MFSEWVKFDQIDASADELEMVRNHHSGLLGIATASGLTHYDER